jgi:hypothetical protein
MGEYCLRWKLQVRFSTVRYVITWPLTVGSGSETCTGNRLAGIQSA